MKKYVPWLIILLTILSIGSVYAYEPGFNYDNPCSDEGVMRVLYIASVVILIIKIAVPVLLVFTGILDLIKVVTGNPENLNKQLIVFAKRAIAGILVFVTPSLVFAIFHILDDAIKYEDIENKYEACISCLEDNGNCQFEKYGE